MSEYQYYEFIALDKALSKTQRQALGKVSSRAEISSTRFANVYHYGNFRGDVNEFMTRYFDAMVFVANWGAHQLMLRLPEDLIDQALLKRYCTDESLTMYRKDKFIVLNFSSNSEDYGGWEEGEGWLPALVPLRAELINGDLRALYLTWLLCAQYRQLDEDEQEPPVPPGLKNLSAALENLVEYLRLDPDLVAAAAVQSEEQTGLPTSIDAWIAALPETDKNQLLLKLMQGQDPHLGTRLLQRFRSSTELPTDAAPASRRTVGELRQATQQQHEARKQTEARRQAEARASYLDGLELRENAVWKHIEDRVTVKQANAYADAVDLLKDLQELSLSRDKTAQFEQRLSALCECHRQKYTFIKRLAAAGLRT